MFNGVTITTQAILNQTVKSNAVTSKITMMEILLNVLMVSINVMVLILIIVLLEELGKWNIVQTVVILQLENAIVVQMAEEIHRNVLMVSTNVADLLLIIVPTVIGNMMNIVPTVAILQLENATAVLEDQVPVIVLIFITAFFSVQRMIVLKHVTTMGVA